MNTRSRMYLRLILLPLLLIGLGCGNESNREASSTPTVAPSVAPRATVSPTPSASPTSTEIFLSPTPGGATYTINGCVVHFSGCGGSQEFGVVTLAPLDRTANVDLGTFSFEDVPAGEYSLTYSPACNPAGCTGTVHVRIVDSDGYAAFYRATPTPQAAQDIRADTSSSVGGLTETRPNSALEPTPKNGAAQRPR